MDAPTIDEVCAVAFGKSIYPYQKQIIEAAFRHRKITIRATTRAGKSYCMAMVAILRAVVLPNHRVGIIAPTHDKTRIIMNYIADLLASNAMFDSWAMVSTEGLTKLERLRKEVSKKRITGTNGSSIECLSVDLDARGFGVMGRAFDCLPAGAVILTDKGKIKVEDMVRERLRCRVLSRGKNGKLEFVFVSKYAVMKAPQETTIATKRNKLKCTANHPFYVKSRGFVKASEIKVGDEVGVVGYGFNKSYQR